MEEEVKTNIEEEKTNIEEVNDNEVPQEQESFWKKLQKPVKPLYGWLIFGGFVVFVILLGLIIFLNC